MFILGIFSIFGLITQISSVIEIAKLAILIIALKSIKKVSTQLNNANFEEFRTKILVAMTIRSIGSIVVSFWTLFILVPYLNAPIYDYGPRFLYFQELLVMFILILVFAFIFMIVGAFKEMKAWENLNIFFTQNSKLFPEIFSRDAIKATRKLRKAALCYVLAFLIVPLIIGFILYIIGYFKLSKLKDLPEPGQEESSNSAQFQPSTPSATSALLSEPSELKFCPNCGSALKPGIKICGECGSKLF